MLKSKKDIDTIFEKVNVLRSLITSKAKQGLVDENKICENFMMNILNIIYDLKLENLNQESKNFPGLDLGDKNRSIAYQITSTISGKKINETLKICLDKGHYETYKGIHIFILTKKQKSYSIKTDTSKYFHFSSKENIHDFDDLYSKCLNQLNNDKLEKLKEYINKEIPNLYLILKGEEENHDNKKEKLSIEDKIRRLEFKPQIEVTFDSIDNNHINFCLINNGGTAILEEWKLISGEFDFLTRPNELPFTLDKVVFKRIPIRLKTYIKTNIINEEFEMELIYSDLLEYKYKSIISKTSDLNKMIIIKTIEI
jgi:hypothetical protein